MVDKLNLGKVVGGSVKSIPGMGIGAGLGEKLGEGLKMGGAGSGGGLGQGLGLGKEDHSGPPNPIVAQNFGLTGKGEGNGLKGVLDKALSHGNVIGGVKNLLIGENGGDSHHILGGKPLDNNGWHHGMSGPMGDINIVGGGFDDGRHYAPEADNSGEDKGKDEKTKAILEAIKKAKEKKRMA